MGIIACSGDEHTTDDLSLSKEADRGSTPKLENPAFYAQNPAMNIEELRFLTTQMTMIEGNLIKATVFFNLILFGVAAVEFSSSLVIGVAGLVCFCGGCTYLLYGVLTIVELQKITVLKTLLQPPPQAANRMKMQSPPYFFVGFGIVSWLFVMYLLIFSIVA